MSYIRHKRQLVHDLTFSTKPAAKVILGRNTVIKSQAKVYVSVHFANKIMFEEGLDKNETA